MSFFLADGSSGLNFAPRVHGNFPIALHQVHIGAQMYVCFLNATIVSSSASSASEVLPQLTTYWC